MNTLRTVKGFCFALIATFIWGGFYPVSRLVFGEGGDDVELFSFTFWRFLLAALFLSLIFLKREKRQLMGTMVQCGDLWRMIALGTIGIVCEGLLVFWSCKYTTGARSSLMANTAPISTMLISWAIGREVMTGRKAMGMLMGFAGLLLVFMQNGEDRFVTGGVSTLLGDFMAVASGVCWAVFTVFGERFSQRYGGMLCCAVMFSAASVIMLAVALIANGGQLWVPSDWKMWGAAIYLGMISYGLCESLWYMALKFLKPGVLGAMNYVTAMFSFSFAALLVDETITIYFMLAVVLVLCGVSLMMRGEKGQGNAEEQQSES